MDSDDRWRLVWGVWVTYFGVAEYYALRSKDPRAPLSYYLRHSLGVPHSPTHRRAGQIALGAGVVWLISHIYDTTTGGPP